MLTETSKKISIFALTTIFLVIGAVVFVARVDAQAACNCLPRGAVSDQGCGQGPNVWPNCPVGTRRVCTCGGGSGGACSPDAGEGFFVDVWNCFCNPDASCTTTTTPPINPPGGCSPTTPPVAPTAGTPNNVTLDGNTANLTWSGGNWGSCASATQDTVWLREANAQGGCGAQDNANFVGQGSTTQFGSLKWGTRYCWYVKRNNGNGFANSNIFTFNTPAPPEIRNFTIVPSTIRCGGSTAIGRATGATASNPLTFQFDVYDARNNFSGGVFTTKNVRIAFANMPNSGDPVLRYYYELGPKLHDPVNKRRAGFRIRNMDTATPAFATVVDNIGAYGAEQTSGNLMNPGGNATLMGINTAQTRVVRLDNQTFRVTMTVRFENAYAELNNDLGIYASTLSRVGGQPVSQDPNPQDPSGDGNLRYRRYALWTTDMTPPTAIVNNPIVGPAPNRFSINWQMSDNIGFRTVRSYCFVNPGAASSIRDQTLGNAQINLPSGVVAYPSLSNCLINSQAQAGTHIYTQSNSTTILPNQNFSLYVEDVACNSATSSTATVDPRPWLMTAGSSASAFAGFQNIPIRTVDPAVLTAISSTLGNEAFLSSYLAISGNANMLTARQSKAGLFTDNYDDLKRLPPAVTGEIQWFDTLFASAGANNTVVNSADTNLTGTFSSNYGLPANTKRVFFHNLNGGTLNVAANATCDYRAIIFVNGNIVVNPNLNKSGTNACMFIATGNITIAAGTYKSAGLPAGSLANYDYVYGFFVADGSFITQRDWTGVVGQLADGLYLRGSVVANIVNFDRDLGSSNNNAQPAEVIEYDPLYLNTFRNDLSLKRFSLREQ